MNIKSFNTWIDCNDPRKRKYILIAVTKLSKLLKSRITTQQRRLLGYGPFPQKKDAIMLELLELDNREATGNPINMNNEDILLETITKNTFLKPLKEKATKELSDALRKGHEFEVPFVRQLLIQSSEGKFVDGKYEILHLWNAGLVESKENPAIKDSIDFIGEMKDTETGENISFGIECKARVRPTTVELQNSIIDQRPGKERTWGDWVQGRVLYQTVDSDSKDFIKYRLVRARAKTRALDPGF